MKTKNLILVVLVGILLAIPLLVGNRYLLHIGITSGVFLLLTLGLFIVTGLTNQLNLGQAAFWAIGAYSYAILAGKFGLPFLPAAALAVLLTTAMSLLFGLPSMKVSGVYFTMVTVGLGEIVRIVLLNWRDLTGGGMGIRGIPRPEFLGLVIKTPAQFYMLTVVVVFLCYIITWKLINSHMGLVMKSVGSNEVVAKGLGVNVFQAKLIALAVSSCFAALAGIIYAGYYGFIHPDAFSAAQSYALVQMLVIGGIHSLAGVTAMTPILTYSLEYMRAFGEYQMIVYSILLILFLIFCPQGVGGLVERYLSRAQRLSGAKESLVQATEGGGKNA